MTTRLGNFGQKGIHITISLSSIVMICVLGCVGPRQQLTGASASLGEYGGNLDYLKSCCSGPRSAGESNYYIDMLGGSFPLFARTAGFTNNNTLFVLSHGKALAKGLTDRYALYPTWTANHSSYYSARDLAQILGANAARIHNIFLAGCNYENALAPKEFRKYFVNATNIVHARPETDASVDAFENILAHSSAEIKSGAVPTLGDFFGSNPVQQKKGNYYIAELFQPGAMHPYKKQAAGRELLASTSPLQLAANAVTNRNSQLLHARR